MRWALLLVFAGCSLEQVPQAEPLCEAPYHSQAEVERAWSFLPTTGPCPCVVWKRRAELDCQRGSPELDDWVPAERGTGNGWIAESTSQGRTCVVGLSNVHENVIWAIQPGNVAHEFVHHWLHRETGDSDGQHRSPIWDGGAMDSAFAAVMAAGVRAP